MVVNTRRRSLKISREVKILWSEDIRYCDFGIRMCYMRLML